jgi:uncharacterized protein YjbI with pentapeptide repeats
MSQCKHYDICGWDVEGDPADGLCILHSTDPAKDTHAFAEALAAHRKHKGDKFSQFVFPDTADFSGATFGGEASFFYATFSKGADFSGATFSEKADFIWATFSERAGFSGATFSKGASFFYATFSGEASFYHATFSEEASFNGATFGGEASFHHATFRAKANFYSATFAGKTRFAGRRRSAEAAGHIFAGTEVNFRQVVIDPPDAVTFLEADLTKCQFRDTDLRKVQLVGITWPQKGQRIVVYDEIADEIAPVESRAGSTRAWPQIERLYRELKQNYEDRRDDERAGDFHYGEKEMRRQNPDTAWGLRLFLTLYWLFSGYGERYLRPLLWAGLLFVASTIGYMWWGLRPNAGGSSLAWTYPWINSWDWLRAAYYSFRVMTLLKSDDWVPLRYAQLVNTFQTLLGPTFLGLFALALRQRLKR